LIILVTVNLCHEKNNLKLYISLLQALSMNHDIELFSMDALLVFVARDPSTPDTTLALSLPYLEKVV